MAERFIVASGWELEMPDFVTKEIWLPAQDLYRQVKSHAKIINLCFCLYDYHGQLFYIDGTPYNPGDISDVFAGKYPERWLRNFLQPDETGKAPRHQPREIERLRVLHAAMQIKASKSWAAQ